VAAGQILCRIARSASAEISGTGQAGASLAASREYSVSDRTVDEIFAEAREIARTRGQMHD
jgi:hypothetical protein